jgi:hypothetical protein
VKGATLRRKILAGCCKPLLDLSRNGIGDKVAGRLAAVLPVLPQCPSLAHLHLSQKRIGDEGAGRLAAVWL